LLLCEALQYNRKVTLKSNKNMSAPLSLVNYVIIGSLFEVPKRNVRL